MTRVVIDGRALLRWILLDLPEPPWPEAEPFVGLVYLDGEEGLSARGWRAGAPDGGALTVRLPIGVPGRVLTDEDASARGLPATPAWLAGLGPQPATDAPWRHDPALLGRLHVRFPDDVPVLVHDGDPRRTSRRGEVCWVRLDAAAEGAPRPVSGQQAATRLYRGALLSRPRALTSVAAGDRVAVLAEPGGRHPLLVTDRYLDERAGWRITPCARCGLHEGLDPPSVMAATRFPDLAVDVRPPAFSAPCPLCSGSLELTRVEPGPAAAPAA
jgi:hypothetical protein